ncbi:hypothetical protein ONS95_013271 [Cadophora gregata]|uniref:uncharacterized protein n=1 Tax=Cadophora gregata TaxID=51156 RepID=UPI0026DC2ED1|nr:uncharacterized protein ONS95_013271 [Cadophora gregata]KAK0116246.1 hypothetical protein ONS95_013271 [Cadophora gregata]
MEKITKVYFDPLVTTKAQIVALLEDLPVGSAHPFSPEKLLLCRTAGGVEEIDISSYAEDHFFKAVDLGEIGQTLQSRMTKFSNLLRIFNDEYTVMQAPASTFEVPIDSDKIAILAVSERYPTYYDLCVADSACKTTCYGATHTFPGINHSGDKNEGTDLLHHMKISEQLQSGKAFAVFVSGFQCTKLTRFQERNPVVMIANHADKALYIVPVPLDAASIGEATICSPVVFKREGTSLICSILPTPTTDHNKMCSSSSLESPSFKEAIQRAEWSIPDPVHARSQLPASESTISMDLGMPQTPLASQKPNVVFSTLTTVLPSTIDKDSTQFIHFGTGLEFVHDGNAASESTASTVVLPCLFGARLEGPLLLATGKVPQSVPFSSEEALRTYYESFESVVVLVDERMTDNARNLATPWRMNAVFVVQMTPATPVAGTEVTKLLDMVNINAVTALAGPQSLVLVQISEKFYFYRGMANHIHLNSAELDFGADVTSSVGETGLKSLLDGRVKRLVNLSEPNTVLLPFSGSMVEPKDLRGLFDSLPLEQLQTLQHDVSAIVPQLQVLLSQKDLMELSRVLISSLSRKVSDGTAPLRTAYIKFLTKEYDLADPESVKQKNAMLGDLRRDNKTFQKSLESIITLLSNMTSSQTSSKRTHDLQRLQRQAAIQNNVEAVKSMTFETLADLLETKAADMGVMLLNIETSRYQELLGTLKSNSLDVDTCCDLDSRVLFLEGFDAGIIMEQSQANHNGPLTHQLGPTHPILALPYLSQERGTGSMVAWVCWDEFVNLKSPFKVRWMDKCNESHIAALRIIMRDTLSQAVSSREHNMQPGNPETGQLMSALLMAAMSKLAAMKTTAPIRTIDAEDTITKLMRGLFGNLLTTAGSGVRPLSMVWQLFGQEPKFDIPSTGVAWSWYESVVRLYPFSGWPQQQFNLNLERLLDKVIIAIVTKNELTENIKRSRADWMIKYCKLRNIQLVHSRTFVTIFIKMIQNDANLEAIASRLLDVLPPKLEKQSQSYQKMMRYLRHIISTGTRREEDDILVTSVYLKRSAVFKELKQAVAKACLDNDNAAIKESCLKVVAKFKDIADSWDVPQEKVIMQNVKAYQGLLDTHCDEMDGMDEASKTIRKGFMQQVISDAEKQRVPWQVGKRGEFGDEIEPLDEGFVTEILTGEKRPALELDPDSASVSATQEVVAQPLGMKQFSEVVSVDFITKMDNLVTPEDVCKMLNIPVSTLRVFASTLNPEFNWEQDLSRNFNAAVIGLLSDRKERQKQQPIRTLFGMDTNTLEVALGDENQIEAAK